MAEGPIEAFELAAKAVEAGDWLGLFRRLTPASLERVAANSIVLLVSNPHLLDEMLAALDRQGEPTAPVRALLDLQERVVASAQALTSGDRDPASMVDASNRHQLLVKELETARKSIFKSWRDRPGTAAVLETILRTRTDSGSVSSSLLLGETLEEFEIGEKKARAVRMSGGEKIAPVAFERRRNGWLIHLFAR